MRQQTFTKSISQLELGDQITVQGDEIQPSLPAPTYNATVIGIKQVRTFGYQAMLLIDGMPDTVTTTDLDLHHKFVLASLEGQDFVWVDLPNVDVGDQVSWWQDIVTIEKIEIEGSTYYITVTDPQDGKAKRHSYKASNALHVKVAEASEEKKQARMRRIAEHMLPPLAYNAGEPADMLAKRIISHIQEWTD